MNQSIYKLIRMLKVYYRHLNLGTNNIYLASYPKSGNTWMKFILAQILTKKDIGYDDAELVIPLVGYQNEQTMAFSNNCRILKTHEPFRREYEKSIYMVRDGRDVAISYYYHLIREGKYSKDFNTFFDEFIEGGGDGLPAWHNHVLGWNDAVNNNDILTIRYEDCLDNIYDIINKILNFIKVDIPDSNINEAIDRSSKEKMLEKEKYALNMTKKSDINFVRNASAGEWRNKLSTEQNNKFIKIAGEALGTFNYIN